MNSEAPGPRQPKFKKTVAAAGAVDAVFSFTTDLANLYSKYLLHLTSNNHHNKRQHDEISHASEFYVNPVTRRISFRLDG
jgi:hypothetical protein